MASQQMLQTLNIMSQVIRAQDQLQHAIGLAQDIINKTPTLYAIAEDLRIDLETALEAIQDAEISSSTLFNNISGKTS